MEKFLSFQTPKKVEHETKEWWSQQQRTTRTDRGEQGQHGESMLGAAGTAKKSSAEPREVVAAMSKLWLARPYIF